MAESLFPIAGGIINSLGGPLAAQEIRLFCGVKGELEKLKDTVLAIKAVLLHAEEQRATNPAVDHWLQMLNDVIYDADDLLDAASTEALRREIMTQGKGKMAKQVRTFFSNSNQLIFRLKLGHKIKAIRGTLDDIAANMRNFQFVERLVEAPIRVMGRDSTYSFVLEEEVIGRENDKMKIIERLMDTNVEGNVSILPIVGIGGLGKTTLAQLVYNDNRIQDHFELRMWICVSDLFNVKNIVEKILKSATRSKLESLQMEEQVKNLKKNIDNKKYLLVLDDVWNEDPEQWSNLKRVLMGGAIGSRIIVTTRVIRVAKIMFRGEPYILKGLGVEASSDLFKQMAFPNEEWPENPSIKEMGRKIITKCAGVPLAVKSVGRLLYFKHPETEWQNFVDNELPNICQDEYDILPTLKLSYDRLPSHLKHCFAFCSLYPKDHVYDKRTLIQEWITHGFVKSSSTNRCLEDVGNDYFIDLLWRSFFQDPQKNDIYILSGCKMHDLMHDLATNVATSLTIISNEKKWKINEKTRHLSICDDLKFSTKDLISKCKERMIRTFLCPKFQGDIDCEAIFSSFKYLRELNLSGNNLDYVPNTIGKLMHLRYLNLSHNNIKKLPASFTKLLNLQFLDLNMCTMLKKLPKDFKNLVNLRYLHLENCIRMTYFPPGLEQLTKLQVLTKFWIHSTSFSKDCAKFSELNGLQLRGKLEIHNVRHSRAFASEYRAANIKGKPGLERLYLHFDGYGTLHDPDVDDETSLEGFEPYPTLKQVYMNSYPSSRLPRWISSITGLVQLSLYDCNRCQCLPPMSQLPSLKTLYFIKMRDLRCVSDHDDRYGFSSSSLVSEVFFPSLDFVRFDECPNLKGWWADSSEEDIDPDNDCIQEAAVTSTAEHCSFPSFLKLSTLELFDCDILTSLPLFPHLEVFYSRNCGWMSLHQTVMTKKPAAIADSTPEGSSFASLSKLKDFTLKNISDLETLPEEWLESFTSLEIMYIERCPHLKSISAGIQYLTSLKQLKLYKCPELELVDDDHGMYWQPLKSLLSLEIDGVPKLVSFPLGFQYVSTLRNLKISDCENLITILESIHHWKSLEVLQIQQCPRLMEVPEGIQCLSSLRKLEIVECPILLQRCERDMGADWPKIAHIPQLDLAQDSNS